MSVLARNFPGSTQLNPSITSYELLAERILRQLGEPLVHVEISREQLYDCISLAIEYFTKYSGYTEEYLIFDSRLYIPGYGLPIERLINITPQLSTLYFNISAAYDYDLNTYRKVINCFSLEQDVQNTNILYTFDYSHLNQILDTGWFIDNYRFDLVTWEIANQFMDVRNKVLALKPHFRFDPQKQLLRIIPEPRNTSIYFGAVGCYIERPLRELIHERWIFRYATALAKIVTANVRGKFTGMTMFGGGQVNAQDFMSQGIAERDALEAELRENAEDRSPPTFFIG